MMFPLYTSELATSIVEGVHLGQPDTTSSALWLKGFTLSIPAQCLLPPSLTLDLLKLYGFFVFVTLIFPLFTNLVSRRYFFFLDTPFFFYGCNKIPVAK